ncbi:glycosyltransferase family 2 protein [Candidatus Kaiserbacteria bacterium]|nr:glycosyltransferase family 2 protein [Candidatus Kaiserbacteria bacterium]
MTTTVIVPTFNEIECIPHILPKLRDLQGVDKIIIVDNNSKDGTIEWCKSHGYTIFIQKNPGYGNAIREAVERASGDILIDFPPDGSSPSEKIPVMVEKIEQGLDLIIASRYRDGAKSYDDDTLTALGNWCFTKLTNFLFNTTYTDVLVGFRGYRKSAYRTLKLNEPHLAWVIQSSIRFATHGYKVGEIGADEPKRIGGKRKMLPFKTGLEILTVILREFFQKPPKS